MLVRRELPPDHAAVHDLHRRAFSGDAEATLVDELRRDGDLLPALTLVAEAAGHVVGHVAVSRATVDGRDIGVVGLGPIGVLPEHQGRGVGSALMHATLAAADALGLRGVVLLGHPTYYPRFGFEPAVDHGITPPQDWSREHFLLRCLTAWGDGSGATGRFRYAAAFERLP